MYTRGYANLCTREDDGPTTRSVALVPGDSAAPNELVRALLDRLGQLEAELRSQDEGARIESPGSLQQISRHIDQNDQGVAAPSRPESDSSTPVEDNLGSVVPDDEDAATVLEYLAWGRNKDAEYGTTSPLASRLLLPRETECGTSAAIFEGSKNATLDLLQTLLPSHEQIRQLVDYHNVFLLWYHGSYSSKIFQHGLQKFLEDCHGDVRHPSLDIQWLALLYAILTGSLTCAPPDTRHTWGFQDIESSTLASQWYEATIKCLNIGQFIERHTISSVEAIATLTIAAHTLGKSSSQSVLLASAGRIAQSLGLHRLGTESEPVSIDQLRQREAGRRVFNQLCTQDWFQIPFSESYSLNPRFITTSIPLNCNDDDMVARPLSIPTQASYCNYRYEIAALMPRLLDATSECNTLFTKYQQVLKYDDKMRKLATASMPTFLSTGSAISTTWPVYVGWARRSLAICAAHKIIMIHRKFLGLSFTNTAFSFTRRTCVAAAKTILKEALSATYQNGPVLWIEQAFSVAAGIVLSLDNAHKDPQQDEFDNHALLMDRTIDYLKSFKGNSIAARGAQLLTALQVDLRRGAYRSTGKRQRGTEEDQLAGPAKHPCLSNPEGFTQATSHTIHSQPTATNIRDAARQPPNNSDDRAMEGPFHPFPIDITLGAQDLFDDLLSFQF